MPSCTARWTHQRQVSWYLLDFFTRENDSTHITLGHLLLKATGKRLGDKEALFDFFDRSEIRDFGDAA